MLKIDTNKIKRMTKEKIAYNNYERKEKMKKRKIIHIVTFVFIIGFFIYGTISVNALTDNKIMDKVKEVFNIKINDKEYNATCKKDTEGNINCHIPEEVTGTDAEASISISEEYLDKIEIEYQDDEMKIMIDE